MERFKTGVKVFLLAMCLVFGYEMFSITVQAEDGEVVASGTCGENVTWQFMGDTLTISGSGDMGDYSMSFDSPWAAYYKDVKKIVIQDGVTSIGKYAFYGMWYCNEVEIASSVTDIGIRAFASMRNIESISIPDGITTIQTGTFLDCRELKYVELPDSVKTIQSMGFDGCGLVDATLRDILSCVMEIGAGAFADNDNLTEIVIPANIVKIGESAFMDCGSLKTITVDAANEFYCVEDNVLFDKSKQTLLWCGSKEGTYTIPDSVTKIGKGAFSGCGNLTEIDIPSGVTAIGREAFKGCRQLTDIVLPDNITTIESYTFKWCEKLMHIVIPSKVTKIDTYAFEDSGLIEINIPESVTSIWYNAFYNTAITSVTIPKGVTLIGEYAFGYVQETKGYTLVENYIIRGYVGSKAEEYANKNNITFIALDEADNTEVTVEVAINCLGAAEDKINLEIMNDTMTSSLELLGDATICQTKLSKGVYTMSVSKKNHVTRTYTITVEDEAIQQEVKLQLVGDVTGDGTINARDKKLIYNHMAGTSLLIDYTFSVGDVTNDGIINARDKKLLYNHIAETNSLWN